MGFFKMCVTKILLLAFIEHNDEEDVTDTSDEYCMNEYIQSIVKKQFALFKSHSMKELMVHRPVN